MTIDLEFLLRFIAELDELKAAYDISVVRPNAVMVTVAVPGERWEVEFLKEGGVEVERFKSNGTITGMEDLHELRRLLQ